MIDIRDISLLLAVLIYGFHAQALNSETATCNASDLIALTSFQNGLKSEIDSWNTTDCCSWVGVVCESLSSSKRVVGLELVSRRLKGSLSESLVGLEQLRSLNISHNSLTGVLPANLFQLQNLEVLDLSDNEFTGFFPGKINLPSIRFLDVSQNYLSGSIRTSLCNPSKSIQLLNLSMNTFSERIPAGFGKCTSLEHLVLNSNQLSGILPEDLFWLHKLRTLHLQGNSLSGPLSDGVFNLSKLVELDISLNMFSGNLPDAFTSMRKLERFIAHSNSFDGRLPLSLSNSPTIHVLNLRNNSFSGAIDLNCTAMIHLSSLILSSNNFNGTIPDGLSFCRNLSNLDLSKNPLGGQVPQSFKNLQSLSVLSLSNNSLSNVSAALEVLQQCKNLRLLLLARSFRGDAEELPAYPNLQFKSLQALVIGDCGFTGVVPQWLSSCKELQLLDLSWNRLTGAIPDFSGLDFLFYVDLSNNSLSGKIPKSLTRMKSLIDRPEKLIPLETASLAIPLYRKIDPQAPGRQYNQIGSFPPSLNLSYNMLTGSIWPEFGNLRNLHALSLEWNQLSGTVPAELSNMRSLEILDLSHNNLSGTIPPSLSNLSFLSMFSVADNHLYGRVPGGGQFSTFPCSSYEGNNGLISDCNSTSVRVTENKPADFPTSAAKPEEHRMAIMGLPFGIGVATGFLVAVIVCFMSGLFLPKTNKGRPRRP